MSCLYLLCLCTFSLSPWDGEKCLLDSFVCLLRVKRLISKADFDLAFDFEDQANNSVCCLKRKVV